MTETSRESFLTGYRFPILDIRDFNQDAQRWKRVVSELQEYAEGGRFRSCLTYNNFVTSANCFGLERTINIIHYQIKDDPSTLGAFNALLVGCGLDPLGEVDEVFLKTFLEDIQCR